jgi:flagellar hook-associated protein 1
MSLSSFLSIARSALLVQQRAMDVTAHNVANASTPGYSRQRLRTEAAMPLWTALGAVGRGVTADVVERMRDSHLDDVFRRENSSLGSSTTLGTFLSQVEGAVAEPSDTGIGSALDGLFTAFADLAADPTSGTSRDGVRQAAQRLVQRVHQLDGNIAQAGADALGQLRGEVQDVNGLLQRIAGLNTRILASGAGGGGSPDLEDQRDQLVDQLSGMMSVQVTRRDDGSVGIIAGDTLLVDGGTSQEIAVRASGAGYGVGTALGTDLIHLTGGSIAALSNLTTTVLPGLRGQLDTMVAALVARMNAIHHTGFTPGGATNTDFFDPAGTTAATFALAAPVAASSDAIAAAGAAGAPGNGSVALQLSTIGTTSLAALGNRTVREYFTEFATGVGSLVADARTETETALTLTDTADGQRTSVSGVSLDEEMTALIAQQQAYGAAAKLVTVAQELADAVLNILG